MITIRECARRTGLSYDCIRKMCRAGQIVHLRIGKKYFVNFGKLCEYLNAEMGMWCKEVSRRNRKVFKPRAFESKGVTYTDADGRQRKDTFAMIYESMLTSPAYTDLTHRQRSLYAACKAQYYGTRKPSSDYPTIEEFKGDDKFYMNWQAVQKYSIYSPTMRKEFYGDMKALAAHGLIRCIASGRSTHRKSVYAYSNEWQTWG